MKKYILLSLTFLTISCRANNPLPTFTVGGTITGLNETVILQNNGEDDLTLTSDGAFTFTTLLPYYTGHYSVTVLTQPAGQVCAVADGSGRMPSAAVTNVTVTCEAALGDTTFIDVTPNMQVGIFSSYNSTNDQFFLTWWDINENNINFMAYNSDESIAVPATALFTDTITPLSDVVSCYNSHLDEYFVVWNEYTTASPMFTVLDSDGNVIEPMTALSVNEASTPVANVSCSYNSTDHQYFLTWVNSTAQSFFAIVNEDGTEEVAETEIPNVDGVQTGGVNLISSYNSTENQYFLTWGGSDFGVYFAIYDATGAAVQTATLIPDSNGYSDVANCYNSTNNQYFIPWRDGSGIVYFSIYNEDGTQVSSPQEISDFSSDIIYGPVSCSHNSVENNYFLAAVAPDTTSINYTILSDEGEIVLTPQSIPNPSDLLTHKAVYTSYGETSDEVFITWTADDSATVFNGYFAIYRFAPLE